MKKSKKKGSFFTRLALFTSLVLVLNFLAPAGELFNVSAYDEELSVEEENLEVSEKIEGIISEELDELNEAVLTDDFELDEEVESMPSISEMTPDELELFNLILEEQLVLNDFSNDDEEEIFADIVTDFFDEDSEYYNDLEAAEENLDEKLLALGNDSGMSLKGLYNKTFGIQTAGAASLRIKNKLAGTLINVAIGFAVGGGVSAIQAFIIKKGKNEAKRIFNKTVKSRLIAWGAPKLATFVSVAVAVALEYMDIGGQLAKQFDKRDKKPNNGYIDFI